MSQIKTSAFVLKSINWKDTSKIVSLYTREIGRVDVIAKGVRRKNHPQTANFEALNYLETIIYFSDKRELQNIGETTLINSFHKIRTDLEKTSVGLAILELIEGVDRKYLEIHPREPDHTFGHIFLYYFG